MRHPHLTHGGSPAVPLIAVAHGSKDPRAAATISELLAQVRSRAADQGIAGLDVRTAFLDHSAPSLRQVLGAMDGACVVVPLLLTAAYHSKTDVPAHIASAASLLPALDIRYADTLGPDPLLIAALERRLAEADPDVGDAGDARRATTSVVLAAAGSSDPAANATIAALAAQWQREGGWRAVVPAYASAASPTPAEAVRALLAAQRGRVVVATYLLAPGYFSDKVRREAAEAGASVTSAALGAAPEVADVILRRYQAAARAAVQDVARAQLS
jgi:sirohydrochlorin ferrochelatase